ncbi:MAG: 50S ribosomal protein L21 [Dehalococcoidales bacterium]|nr:50S ribosomal protein L21 [Dehalococcoidales bacterium]
MYAIIEAGGKQYRVTPGQTIDVENLNVIEGDAVELDKVLVIGDDKSTTIGMPHVEGAKVLATSQGTVRSKKIIVFKYKSKVRYRKKTGQHHLYTRLSIDKIEAPGLGEQESVKKAPVKKEPVKKALAKKAAVKKESVKKEPVKKSGRRKKEEAGSGS